MNQTTMLIKEMVRSYITQDQRRLKSIIHSGQIAWDFFVEQIIKHKLVSLAYMVLKDEFEVSVPFYLAEWISQQYHANKYATEITTEYIGELCLRLQEENIPFVIVKGISLDALLYHNDSVKKVSDVDILINPNTTERLKLFFSKLSICEGKYNYIYNQPSPLEREKRLLFMLTRDHMPEYMLRTDNPLHNTIKLDISINNDWTKMGNENIFADAIDKPKKLLLNNGSIINIMDNCRHFIYIILHLYRHAWSYRFIKRNISIRLSMFNDILLFWTQYKSIIKGEVLDVLKNHLSLEQREQVAWVLHHLDSLYNTEICNELELNVNNDTINSAFHESGKLMNWEGSIENRLWSRNEQDLFFCM